jgi:hypothetical protein
MPVSPESPAYYLRAFAATLARLTGVPPPDAAARDVIPEVTAAAATAFRNGFARRALIYAPDALGAAFFARHPDLNAAVTAVAPLAVPMRAAYPPKTPVCFATMFTGAAPAFHGITVYERPVVRVDSLFDAWARAGKRVALVAVRGSSLDLIFRGRPITYISGEYDADVTREVTAILAADDADVVVAYHQEYDDRLHADGWESEAMLGAAANHVASFRELAAAADRHWAGYGRLVCFAPDHGAHADAATGRGNHGDDIPEDMDVTHFYGFAAAGG